MVEQYARLRLTVDSDADKAAKDLDKLGRNATGAEKKTKNLSRTAKRLGAVLSGLAVTGVFAGFNKIKNVTRQFDVLNAQLITATGSVDGASAAFSRIKKLAATTPYDLAQVTTAFVKLKNFGLDPSQEAIVSYGNTASAMGKSLDQLIEAVADAATGEFERLKEFGIKTKNQGDTIAFTFRGITTEVANNSAEIQSYLKKLGDTDFAGAMKRRMDSLDGSLSNLADSWDNLFLEIGKGSGASAALKDSTDELASVLKDPEFIQGITNLTAGIVSLSSALAKGVGHVGMFFGALEHAFFREYDLTNMVDVEDKLEDAREKLKQLQEMSSRELNLFDWSKDIDETKELISTLELLQANWNVHGTTKIGPNPGGVAGSSAAAIAGRIPKPKYVTGGGFGDEDEDADTKTPSKKASSSAAEFASLVDRLMSEDEAIRKSYETRNQIIAENTARGSERQKNLLEKSKKLYEADLAAVRESERDKFESIAHNLSSQQDKITAEYQRRREIILENTEATELEKAALIEKLSSKYDEDLEALRDAERQKLESVENSLLTQNELYQREYQRRREIILENTEATELEKADLIQRLENERQEYMLEQNQSFWDRYLEAAEENLYSLDELSRSTIETFSDGVAGAIERMIFEAESFEDAMKGVAKGMAKSVISALSKMAAEWLAYKAVQMLVGKSTAGSSATLMATQAAAASVQSGLNAFMSTAAIPVTGPAMAPAAMKSAIAATAPLAAAVAAISAGGFAGAFDEGGYIPSGKFGLVGEYGPEIINGPANVTSRKDTRNMIEKAANNAGSNSNVFNFAFNGSTSNQAEMEEYAEYIEQRILARLSNNERTRRDRYA